MSHPDPPPTGRPNRSEQRRSSARTVPAGSLHEALTDPTSFVTCVELVTSRGVITERNGRRVLDLARQLAHHPRINALSITDNPGGNAMLGADTLGTDLIARGQEVIIHLSCKDWNRNAIQSRGWELASGGFNNVLALSGDCPTSGFAGQAQGVFDIDSVGLLEMFSQMNGGLPALGPTSGPSRRMRPTHFFMGAVVNNFKLHEREVMPQYFKLARKIDAGAGFIINQLGYDSRKQDELVKYMHRASLNVPVLGNVYVLSGPAARFFHAGRIPGCVVTDALMKLCERHAASEDKGKSFFLEFAAKQVAIARGVGYRGAYLGGHLKFDDYVRILEKVDTFAPDDWRQFAREIRFSKPGEFYFFEPDGDTGLATTEVNAEYVRSTTPKGRTSLRRTVPLTYRMNRVLHAGVFEKGSPGFNVGKRLFGRLDRAGRTVQRLVHATEKSAKSACFDCQDCGDCSLPDIAYLCPESQCAKNQRNGPCGGTHDGQCEVGEKQCIWALAYDRLKPYGEEGNMLDRPVVFKDGVLQGTSAWTNTFLERDHHARVRQDAADSSGETA